MGSYLLNAPDEKLDHWRVAARAKGLTLAEFLRRAGDHYAGDALPAPQEIRLATPHFRPDPK